MLDIRVLVFSCFLALPYVAAIEPSQLDIQLNSALATNANKVVFGSVVQISGLRHWTDGQIVHLAIQAHKAVNAKCMETFTDDFKKKNPNLSTTKPRVTTTMVLDDTAYISSSLTGGPYLYIPEVNPKSDEPRFKQLDPLHPCDGPVKDALLACQVHSVAKSGHRTGASCGEPMAMMAFCATRNVGNLNGAKILTIMGRDNPDIIPPCVNPGATLAYQGEWGCHDFTTQNGLGMRVIPKGTNALAIVVPDSDITVSRVTWG
ncbi:hypothetical protein BDV96DRAFT_600715 [Lophiotrema nucula]|uniref:Uncharacterized protein n=1 Tax=Lophiotrema nucula TaxID=690887 RepID=A0A6A5Z4Z2_9PLEO|nr:hypothetical protein BDV96DRAFT_600715 [Lophiotrema nucula]